MGPAWICDSPLLPITGALGKRLPLPWAIEPFCLNYAPPNPYAEILTYLMNIRKGSGNCTTLVKSQSRSDLPTGHLWETPLSLGLMGKSHEGSNPCSHPTPRPRLPS